MVTDNEGLLADKLTTAIDPISCRQHFWDALAIADESLGVEATSQVQPPPVEIQRFDFDDIEYVDAEVGQGTLVMPVEPGSPSAVLNAWNHKGKRTMVLLGFEKMCLVRNPTDKGAGDKDYRACVTIGCDVVSHCGPDAGGSQHKFRLHRTDKNIGSVLAIRVIPSSIGQKLETVFSRPLFCIEDLPTMIEGGMTTAWTCC